MSGLNVNYFPSNIKYAYMALNTQTNLNNAPIQDRDIVFNTGSFVTTIPNVTAAGTTFNNIPPGTYLVFAMLYTTSFSTRTGLIVRSRINGDVESPTAATGYIRNSNGHNASSYTLATLKTVTNTTSSFGLSAAREANAGLVISSGPDSEMFIIKLS